MPHFCQCGADDYICQSCGRIRCSKDHKPKWFENFGNVCPECRNFFKEFQTEGSVMVNTGQ